MKTDEELAKFSRDNWLTIPEAKRQECIAHLHNLIGPAAIADIKKAMQEPMFHSFGGMWVRNMLRGAMKDEELPGIIYPDHPEAGLIKNWDDYYMGCLEELTKDVP